MRKFRFSLEGAARVRDLAVRRSESDLARAHEALARAEERKSRSEAELRRSLASAPRGTVVQVRQLLERDRELGRLHARIRLEEQARRSGEVRVETERGNLIEARRRAEAVEKLRLRRYGEFLRAVLGEEQKATDEVASRRVQMKRAA